MKNRKSMIKIVAALTGVVVAATAFFYSCDKTNKGPVAELNKADSYNATNETKPIVCGTGTKADFVMLDQTRIGEIQVSNDGNNLHVTYALDAGTQLAEINLYVGDKNTIPVKADGQPDVTRFPYSVKFSAAGVRIYSFAIPLKGNIKDCNAVAAYALVKTDDGSGAPTRSKEAWAMGEVIYKADMQRTPTKSLMGMQFEYCIQRCDDVNEGCAWNANYWFEGNEGAWIDNQVNVAGFVYSKEEALTIWKTSNPVSDPVKRGVPTTIPDSKVCFAQVAAIRLSGNTVFAPASVWSDVNVVEKWLSGLGKLNPNALPSDNPEALAAALRIEKWIETNQCKIK
jgi:hypothetical protein